MITLRGVTLRRGTRVLLDNTDLVINPGEKVGLVGRNGAGKSTLFSLLAGRLHEDAGDFSMPPSWTLAEVAQHMPETSQAATDFVIDGDLPLLRARQQLADAEAADDGEAIGHAHAALADAGAHDARSRAQTLILGLGFRTDQLDHPVDSFSGGWRMRLQLARALMCPADLLLLDEPTNHLDLDALVWLEGWLQRHEGTMVVISHDREFLDAVTRVTVHIDQGRLARYGGNYSTFEDMLAERIAQQQSAYVRQQDQIAQLQRFIDRFKAKATKARQAQSRVKALERMERIAPVLTASDFHFEFREPASLPNPMLAMRDAAFGYAAGQPILDGVNRTVLAGQRIGILGANGQGKSTLVKTIARAVPLLGGKLTEGKGLSVGYFAQQELDVLREQDTPLEHMARVARQTGVHATEQELRNFLGSFRFEGDMVHQAVGTLSGGERARLALSGIVWQRPNLLLLDEPTNHLDLTTREALGVALNEFEGTVMLVSHDRALLRSVCDEFWLVARGAVQPFDGDLDDYQRFLLDEARRIRDSLRQGARDAAPTPAVATPVAPTEPSATSSASQKEQRRLDAQRRQALADRVRPLKREVEQIDRRMAELAGEKAAIEERMAQPLSGPDIALAGKRLKAVGDEIAALEERWLELSEQIEAALA